MTNNEQRDEFILGLVDKYNYAFANVNRENIIDILTIVYNQGSIDANNTVLRRLNTNPETQKVLDHLNTPNEETKD